MKFAPKIGLTFADSSALELELCKDWKSHDCCHQIAPKINNKQNFLNQYVSIWVSCHDTSIFKAHYISRAVV